MISVGIDDTDVLGAPGTNQLARRLADHLAGRWDCVRILRHQLLFDPRIPYTNKNGSACIHLTPVGTRQHTELTDELSALVGSWSAPGSDPGLCIAADVPPAVTDFGRRCQAEVVTQADALALAARLGIFLKGLGGTNGGVIGALAAVGLAATGEDGRLVRLGTWPDDLTGCQPAEAVRARGVEVRELESGRAVSTGLIDLGKRLRPNFRSGQHILFVRPQDNTDANASWQAVKLT